MGQIGQIQAHKFAPVADGEQVRIGHGELAAHQIVFACQLRLQPFKAAAQVAQRGGLERFGRAGHKQRAKRLVQLRANEIQPFQHAIALHGAGGGNQLFLGHLVGQVLHDHRAFTQGLAIVQHQKGHIAQGIDAVEIRAVLQLVALGAGQDVFAGQTCLFGHDVG